MDTLVEYYVNVLGNMVAVPLRLGSVKLSLFFHLEVIEGLARGEPKPFSPCSNNIFLH